MSFYANEFELASLAGPRGLALRGQWQGSCPNAHRQAAGVGCAYFKTAFMHFGCEYGPQQARRHQEGPSRIEIWMRLVRLIREEIGAATWMASGGRDIGVSRQGHYSAESLLRDQTARTSRTESSGRPPRIGSLSDSESRLQ